MAEEEKYWGYHLMVDCAQCPKGTIDNKDVIIAFSKALVERIDMVAFGEPYVPHFATHDPEKGGFTLVQLIETSAITGHFVDANGSAYLDIFSCKPFDQDVVLATIDEFFKPLLKTPFFRKRQA